MTEKIDSLTSQIGDMPIIHYQDLALSIDGENVPVNSKDSMAVIDSNEYASKEIVEKLVDESQNVTYKNGTILHDCSIVRSFSQYIMEIECFRKCCLISFTI